MINFLWQLLVGIVVTSMITLLAWFCYNLREHKQKYVAWLLIATFLFSATLALLWKEQQQQQSMRHLESDARSWRTKAKNFDKLLEALEASASDVPRAESDAMQLSIDALHQKLEQLEQNTAGLPDDTPILIEEDSEALQDSATECANPDEYMIMSANLEQATQELVESNNTIVALQQQCDAISQHSANFMLEIDALSEDRAALYLERAALMEQTEGLVGERDTLVAELFNFTQQLDALSQQNTSLTEERAAMMARQEVLIAQIEALTLERAASSAEITALQTAITNLEAELAANQATE